MSKIPYVFQIFNVVFTLQNNEISLKIDEKG